jgi:hypothetical protein
LASNEGSTPQSIARQRDKTAQCFMHCIALLKTSVVQPPAERPPLGQSPKGALVVPNGCRPPVRVAGAEPSDMQLYKQDATITDGGGGTWGGSPARTAGARARDAARAFAQGRG